MYQVDQGAYWQAQAVYWAPKILIAILILIATWIVARAVKWVLQKAIDRTPALRKHTTGKPGETVGHQLGVIAKLIIWLAGIMAAVSFLGFPQILAPINALTLRIFEFLPPCLQGENRVQLILQGRNEQYVHRSSGRNRRLGLGRLPLGRSLQISDVKSFRYRGYQLYLSRIVPQKPLEQGSVDQPPAIEDLDGLAGEVVHHCAGAGERPSDLRAMRTVPQPRPQFCVAE